MQQSVQAADTSTLSLAPRADAANDELFLSDEVEAFSRWLNLQCSLLKGVLNARLFAVPTSALAETPSVERSIAQWPRPSKDPMDATALAQRALAEQQDWIGETQTLGKHHSQRLALLLPKNKQFAGVILLDILPRDDAGLDALKSMLLWGAQWLELTADQTHKREPTPLPIMEIAQRCTERSLLYDSLTQLVTELAAGLACTRVSIGFAKREHCEVRAVSHAAGFSKQADAIRRLSDAMDEAMRQDCIIRIPTTQTHLSQLSHERLVLDGSNASVCSIPISLKQETIAVVVLERPLGAAFTDQEIDAVQSLCALLAGSWELMRERERPWYSRIRRRARQLKVLLASPGNGASKLKFAATIIALAFILFADGQYRVSAPAVVEGKVQRVISAPMDGFLAEQFARAGDQIQQGQELGALDDRDLKLDQVSIAAEQQELLGEYREAMAEHDNAKVSILSARIEQANAQMKLVNEKLKRTRLIAPFDGIIIEGDLSQSLGAPIVKGDALFKLAPKDEFRIMLEVSDSDIAQLQARQSGELALSSLPGETLPFEVSKITAVSTAEDSRNFFRVEARLLEERKDLRPGMEGVAKVQLGERSLLWIWTHDAINWLRLQLWRWLP